ncbi:MAG6450 family protein [Lacticaseibacillus kribbianus]|uniref:MAG6450 family protein n=1 Tax=Lacticaseibacillus kribbianus TaxID=2926292 RepID=UPI001CD7E847|nr:hypothetical protein [Lacticaseibacillus kribbianus]
MRRLTKQQRSGEATPQPELLTNRTHHVGDVRGDKLARDSRTTRQFILTIDHQLERHYQFKNLKTQEIQEFSRFVAETVGKALTITQVDARFLRTKGPRGVGASETIDGARVTMVHYGRDRSPFRLFGYYDAAGYFVIHRLDPRHQYHRE